jgi:uncharacterized membrane protein
MSARRLASVAIVALAAWIVAWHTWLAPPLELPRGLALGLHLAPLAPALILLALRRRSATFWGAIAALLLFCHGIAEAWSVTDLRWIAAVEVALSVVVIFAGSWDGLSARWAKRRGV